jgi:hypothetical protein
MRKIFFLGFKLNCACDGKDIKIRKLFGFNIASNKREMFIKLKFEINSIFLLDLEMGKA